MAKLRTGPEIGFNIGIMTVMLLFLNLGLLPLFTEAPAYPNIACEPSKGPGDATGCGPAFDAAQATYQDQLQSHERVIFYASSIIGIILLVGGLFLSRIPAIAWGVMLSGVFQFAIGTARYWEHLNKYAAALILGSGVVLLAVMAWRFAKR